MTLSAKYALILDKLAGALLRIPAPPPPEVFVMTVTRMHQTRRLFSVCIRELGSRRVVREDLFNVIELISIIRQSYYSNTYLFKIWDGIVECRAPQHKVDGLFQYVHRLDALGHTHTLDRTVRIDHSVVEDLRATVSSMPVDQNGEPLTFFRVGLLGAGGGGSGGGSGGPR